jgi:hypothetical protein
MYLERLVAKCGDGECHLGSPLVSMCGTTRRLGGITEQRGDARAEAGIQIFGPGGSGGELVQMSIYIYMWMMFSHKYTYQYCSCTSMIGSDVGNDWIGSDWIGSDIELGGIGLCTDACPKIRSV